MLHNVRTSAFNALMRLATRVTMPVRMPNGLLELSITDLNEIAIGITKIDRYELSYSPGFFRRAFDDFNALRLKPSNHIYHGNIGQEAEIAASRDCFLCKAW